MNNSPKCMNKECTKRDECKLYVELVEHGDTYSIFAPTCNEAINFMCEQQITEEYKN